MKIEMNTIYHLPTQELEDDFLKQADKQGIRWSVTNSRADVESHWNSHHVNYCVDTDDNDGHLRYGNKKVYEKYFSTTPIIKWQIGFTKADMQIGQYYKMRNGNMMFWTQQESGYNENLECESSNVWDIIEVYPMEITPIWKRSEPKYRVKTELTKEQAEKLGLEFCEEVE